MGQRTLQNYCEHCDFQCHVTLRGFSHKEKCDDASECSVEKSAHVDVLPASNAGGPDALNKTIDEATKIATWL